MSCNGCLIFSTCYDKYPIDLKPPCASILNETTARAAGGPGTANKLDDCGNCQYKFSCKFSRFCKDKFLVCQHWVYCYNNLTSPIV
jgi:hypothetical protein